MGLGGQGHASAALHPGKDPVLIVYEAGWAGAENLALTRIRSPDRPASSDSLYWLSYPGPCSLCVTRFQLISIFKELKNKLDGAELFLISLYWG